MVRPAAVVVLIGVLLLNVADSSLLAGDAIFYLWAALAAFCFGAMQTHIKRFNGRSHRITLSYCRLLFWALLHALVGQRRQSCGAQQQEEWAQSSLSKRHL